LRHGPKRRHDMARLLGLAWIDRTSHGCFSTKCPEKHDYCYLRQGRKGKTSLNEDCPNFEGFEMEDWTGIVLCNLAEADDLQL